jgi:hypothetical protein
MDLRPSLVALLVVLSAGCTGDFEGGLRFARVRQGMSQSEVTSLLGAPTYRRSLARQTWQAVGLRHMGLSETVEEWVWGGCEAWDMGTPQRFVVFAGRADRPVASWQVLDKHKGVFGAIH